MHAYVCFKRGVTKIARAFGTPFSLLTEPNLCLGELVVLATPLEDSTIICFIDRKEFKIFFTLIGKNVCV